ncbi:MAG TPA: GTP 3',8-cyclase MoaA [Nitrospiraceae bacterium]|nr:GTP 3',8-cyclase MoaA [Nitrospiraceae bacterium]
MPLYDHHNRGIDYLRISVTDRCNLACVYCKPRQNMHVLPHREILQYEEMHRLATVAAGLGISRVRVTGGEPLVRRGVIDFIASLGSIPGLQDISLTTNGVLLPAMIDDLHGAGLRRLNISLDSLEPRKFSEITGMQAWDSVWRGIERAEELGFTPLKINMVPVRGVNDDEIVAFSLLTRSRRIHVRFIEFMPIGANDRWCTEACVTADETRDIIEREIGPLTPFTTESGAGPSQNYTIPGARGVIGFISPITKHFCSTCRRLRLTADGKIRPCLLSDTEIDVKSPMRGGCDDEELRRLLKCALQIKPERHYIHATAQGCYERTMSKIGG